MIQTEAVRPEVVTQQVVVNAADGDDVTAIIITSLGFGDFLVNHE